MLRQGRDRVRPDQEERKKTKRPDSLCYWGVGGEAVSGSAMFVWWFQSLASCAVGLELPFAKGEVKARSVQSSPSPLQGGGGAMRAQGQRQWVQVLVCTTAP